MATTFQFEEFDDATREYLLEVREREGRGSPGVFAPVTASMAGCGCIAGPILVITTLCGTLFSGIILNDPARVAMLQTAGIVLGAWMMIAAFRIWSSKNSTKRAGTWVYGDPLYLYEAVGEQVKVTPVEDVIEAQFTHNYNNGAYQNSVVKLLLPGNKIVSATVNNEQRAEHMVVYYNYLAWARGGEGGDRASLAPAVLGGLAKYVAKNDNEPLDAEGNVNLNLVELEMSEIPEEPRREGSAGINFLPYLFIIVGGIACFFVMKQVNIPFRDDEIYKAITPPNPVQPVLLREYLLDTRNTKHREDVKQRLAATYNRVIAHVQANTKGDTKLKAGMLEVLNELKTADQPTVSIRVKEDGTPPNATGGATERTKKVQTELVKQVSDTFGKVEPVAQLQAGMQWQGTPPPPVGHQLIDFVEAPEEAAATHFEINYKFEPDKTPGLFLVKYTVTIRTKIEDSPVAKNEFFLSDKYSAANLDNAATAIANQVFNDMIGPSGGGPVPQPGGFNP